MNITYLYTDSLKQLVSRTDTLNVLAKLTYDKKQKQKAKESALICHKRQFISFSKYIGFESGNQFPFLVGNINLVISDGAADVAAAWLRHTTHHPVRCRAER